MNFVGRFFRFTGLVHCQKRFQARWKRQYLQDLWGRRILLGADDPSPRSSRPTWNHDVELFAFGKRLGETFEVETLKHAFTDVSYLKKLRKEQQALVCNENNEDDSEGMPADFQHNAELSRIGRKIVDTYTKAYLRYHLPRFPEEGICTVSNFLTSSDSLVTLSKNLGLVDLVQSSIYPPEEDILCKAFTALVGALNKDSGESRAELFVQDFVLTQLIELDINEVWYLDDPFNILMQLLAKEHRPFPEARLLRQAGSFTTMPVYVVGIYVDKQLIGESAGESLLVAKEMAARNGLTRYWHSSPDIVKFAFGDAGRSIDVSKHRTRKNVSLAELGIDFKLSQRLYEEPLDVGEMYMKYKQKVQKTFGTPYRRHLKHRFYPGTLAKYMPRRLIAPKPYSI